MTLSIPASLKALLAPGGRVRASINVGNPILAGRASADAEPYGISVDLARAWAGELGATLELKVFEKAALSVDAVTRDEADIGFFAIDPARADGLLFTAPYVLIEGAYVVRERSLLTRIDEIDRAGHRIMVGQGSAYDLFLSRTLKAATIERHPSSHVPTIIADFLAGNVEVLAGIRQAFETVATPGSGLRLIPGAFMTIEQAMGMPRGRGEAAIAVLRDFVERMKASGLVAESMRRHGIEGARVAGPAAR
jgi:polar amino acid transport system substrate-binding protein